MGEMTYDSKSLELAEHFLSDCDLSGWSESGLVHLLAQNIQRAIEDFIAEHELKDKA